MHSLLESYLSEVSAHLGALPTKRRAEELREMRAHLENAVIVNQEMGQTEDEAARAAVAQFGTAQDLGENVVWAWRRGRVLDGRSFLGAAAVTALMVCLGLFLMDQGHIYSYLPAWFNRRCAEHPEYVMSFVRGTFLATFGLAGLVAGGLFPKRAVRGACLGLVAFWIGWGAVDGLGRGGLWSCLFYGDQAAWMLTALGSAWAGSRGRLAWERRGRRARG